MNAWISVMLWLLLLCRKKLFFGKFVEFEVVHMTHGIRSYYQWCRLLYTLYQWCILYSLDGINMLMMLAYLYFVSTISITNGINQEHKLESRTIAVSDTA